MKQHGINIGVTSTVVGLVLCAIKASGAGLATWSWWITTAPLWGPMLVFGLFLVFLYIVVGTRIGADNVATTLFQNPAPTKHQSVPTPDDFTLEEHELFQKFLDPDIQKRFKLWLDKHGNF